MLTILYCIRISSIADSFDFQANTESGNAKLGVYVEHSRSYEGGIQMGESRRIESASDTTCVVVVSSSVVCC